MEGVLQAQVCYGRLLLEGTGVARDAPAALRWFYRAAAQGAAASQRAAASQGTADALNMVGRCHDNGWGTPESPTTAARYYGSAAAMEHAWAQYNLGHLYLDGRGVERNFDKAYELYRRAADQGHARAMNLVGRCAEEGWGTSRAPRAAADWYRRSAHAGYFRGQYNWATVLLKAGHIEEAARWFEHAAVGGTASVRRTVTELVDQLVSHGIGMMEFQRLATRLNSAALPR
jgi:TPR repeat protein